MLGWARVYKLFALGSNQPRSGRNLGSPRGRSASQQDLPYSGSTNKSGVLPLGAEWPTQQCGTYGCNSAQAGSHQSVTSATLCHVAKCGSYESRRWTWPCTQLNSQLPEPRLRAPPHSDHYPPAFTSRPFNMSTSHATASFYSSSAVSTETVIVDQDIQRLLDEFDHIGLSIPLDAIFRGLEQDGEPNPAVLTPDEKYLSLYDLCGGDPYLVDTIKQGNSSPLVNPSTTPLLCAVTPSPESNSFPFPPLNVGGKWVPGSLDAPTLHVPPVLPALTTPVTQARLVTPEQAPAPRRVCPSRRVKNAYTTHHRPARTAAPVLCMARSSTSGRRRWRTRTQDYLNRYPANAQDITRLYGYRAMIQEGRWGPIIVDALQQIGVPYPMMGLQKVLSELYDGEGEQEGWPAEAKDRPAYPWRVSLQIFWSPRTASDDIFF